jgi:hypothetical protein
MKGDLKSRLSALEKRAGKNRAVEIIMARDERELAEKRKALKARPGVEYIGIISAIPRPGDRPPVREDEAQRLAAEVESLEREAAELKREKA